MEPIKNMPEGLLSSLQKKGYDLTPTAVATADMTNEGELRYLYLLLTEDELVFVVTAVTERMQFGGFLPREREFTPDDIAEVHRYPLSTIKNPTISNQVVGGLLVVTIDEVDTWICRFSSARLRTMQRFVRKLKKATGEEEDHAAYLPFIR